MRTAQEPDAAPIAARGGATTTLFAHPGAELFGSDRMLLESVRGAVEAGGSCLVALPQHGPLEDALRAIGARVAIAPMLVLRRSLLRPRGWPRLVLDAVRGASAAWRLLGEARPSSVYVSTVTLPLWPVVARARGIPAVTHVHEAEASSGRLRNAVLYAPHLLARRTIANSAFTAATMRRSLPALARGCAVVPNGVEGPEHPRPPRASIDGPLRILFVGRLSPRKGPDVALRAAALLAERGIASTLDVVGAPFAGYEWFEDELRAAAAATPAVRIRFHGFVDDVRPHLADADVLVVPSTAEESFGNAAIEGVLAMRPVVASDTSGLREAAEGCGSVRLVPPGDAAALADALQDVAERWASLVGEVGADRERVRSRHAPERYRAAIATQLRDLRLPDLSLREAHGQQRPRRP